MLSRRNESQRIALSTALIVREHLNYTLAAVALAKYDEQPEAIAPLPNEDPRLIENSVSVEITANVKRDIELVAIFSPSPSDFVGRSFLQ